MRKTADIQRRLNRLFYVARMQYSGRPNLHCRAVGGFRIAFIDNLYRLLLAFQFPLQGRTVIVKNGFHRGPGGWPGKIGIVRIGQPALEGFTHRLIAYLAMML